MCLPPASPSCLLSTRESRSVRRECGRVSGRVGDQQMLTGACLSPRSSGAQPSHYPRPTSPSACPDSFRGHTVQGQTPGHGTSWALARLGGLQMTEPFSPVSSPPSAEPRARARPEGLSLRHPRGGGVLPGVPQQGGAGCSRGTGSAEEQGEAPPSLPGGCEGQPRRGGAGTPPPRNTPTRQGARVCPPLVFDLHPITSGWCDEDLPSPHGMHKSSHPINLKE